MEQSSVLILGESEVEQVLTMGGCIEVIERAFRDYAAGEIQLLPRASLDVPGNGGMFRIMAAVMPRLGTFGLKTLTGYPGRRLSGETYFAMLLFTAEHGGLRAIVAANHLTGVRTGAATGLAAKYLARRDATRLGVIGTGVQAKHQMAGIMAVRPVRHVTVFDIQRASAEALAGFVAREFGVDVSLAENPREAVAGMDMVVTVTTSRESFLHADWLEAGMHVSAVGANSPAKRELDPQSFRRSKVVVDFKDQVMAEAGDLRKAIETGVITPEHVHAELGEIVTGSKPGRTDDREITVFKSVGVALEDVATAVLVYDEARNRGLGTWVTLDGVPPHQEAVSPQVSRTVRGKAT